MPDTYALVCDLLHDKFDVAVDPIPLDATLDEIELDSLALVELLIVLQDRLAIVLDESETKSGLTVEGLIAMIDARLPPQPGPQSRALAGDGAS